MSLPNYADLRKGCKDLFSKGYHVGKIKVTTKQQTCTGLEINTNGTQSIEDKAVVADVQGKKNWGSYGLTTAVKWNTDNMITKGVTCQDYLAQGLKLGVEGRMNIDTGTKGGLLMGQYKMNNATLEASVEGGDESNLLVNASVVGGYQNYIGGYQLSYDTNDGSMKANNLAAGIRADGMTALVSWDNMENFSASYYQQVGGDLETGILANTKGEDGPSLAIAAKYAVTPDGFTIRGKVDNKSQVGAGLEVKVASGATLVLSTSVDMNNFQAGAHKVGLALEFQ